MFAYALTGASRLIACFCVFALVGVVPAAAQELRIARLTDWSTLDPHQTRSSGATEILRLIGETPVRLSPDLKGIEPGYAESWAVSQDRLSYTLTLQEGLAFCSGKTVTAADVVTSTERLLDLGKLSYLAGPIQSVEALDDRRVRFELKVPDVNFLRYLAGSPHTLIDPAIAAEEGVAFGASGIDGTGPYCFVERLENGDTVLARKRSWSRKGSGPDLSGVLVPPGRVVFVPYSDERALLDALIDGSVDMTRHAPLWALGYLREDDAFAVIESQRRFWSWHLGLRPSRPLTGDASIRAAIASAIDLGPLLANEFSGEALPALHMIDPRAEGALAEDVAPATSLDREAADRLLTEAGWTLDDAGKRVKDGEPLDLVAYVTAQGPSKRLMDAIAAQLETLGITVTIQAYQGDAYWRALADGDYDFYVMGLPYTTAEEFLMLTFSSSALGATNRLGWQDEETDSVLIAARSNPDQTARFDAVRDLQQSLAQRQVLIGLAHEVQWLVLRKAN